MLDRTHNDVQKDSAAFFGFFECLDDQEAATALLAGRVGTVNAVFGAILREFAIAAGRSPLTDVIPEERELGIASVEGDEGVNGVHSGLGTAYRAVDGADHGGFELKQQLVRHLQGQGHQIEDCGTSPLVQAALHAFIEEGAHNAVESYRLAADGTILDELDPGIPAGPVVVVVGSVQVQSASHAPAHAAPPGSQTSPPSASTWPAASAW